MEYKDCVFSAGPKDANLYEWVAALPGPDDTPYEGGKSTTVLSSPPYFHHSADTVTRRRIFPVHQIPTRLSIQRTNSDLPNPHIPLQHKQHR